ncbi:efflux RND transporter periplasmic adaptor subunit [Litoreibacter janthinus]|uniref:RND family efflux transporter, MFP subunit n=1 Tax=Litoreibacter janthinus TaxID=670154 RepID=A0A1I6HY83_9RHOB|nr:efflux RND transporter periplasmic adaptor subunit [Litoreibacter janthinus]SFR59368.1 RND family efflux transporter, MFP subunit [Litoreibacter janthinus]
MKKLIVVIASLGVLAGSYGIAFGVPEQVALIFGSAPVENANQTRGKNAVRRGPGRSTTVVLAPLEESTYTLVLRAVGSAISLRRADVMSTEAGEVVEAALEANNLVEKGDIILRLDDRTQRLSLEIAQANRDQAQATVTRYEGLHKNGSSVVTDVALSEAGVALRLAQANVGLAELALENRTIVAPISGRLGLSDVDVGDRLSSGDLIVTIDESATLLAEFEVPERSIGLLAKGKPVFVSTPTYAGRVFEGRITAFDSRLDSVTRSATVQAEIDNSEGLLLSGMTFATRMYEETAPLPVVPSTAITWDRSGAGIWVAEDGKTSRVPVTIRYREGDRVWIETAASLGAQIVVEGASKLRDGTQIATAQPREAQGS